jgi:hypothetical protein
MLGSSKGKLLAFSVFVLGIGTGALGTYEYQTRVVEPREEVENSNRGNRERRARQDVTRFHDYLGLSEEQRIQVDQIMQEDRSQFRALQQKTRPEFEALQEGTRAKIRAVLSAEQQQKYDEYLSRPRRDGRRRD